MTSGTSDDASDEETLSIGQVLDRLVALESEAADALPLDITRCSRSLGPTRQSVYSCLTCHPAPSLSQPRPQSRVRAGLCSSCSVSCHGDHQLVELFLRRSFVCECASSKFSPGTCRLRIAPAESSQAPLGYENKYDHNFDGQFCICERGKRYDPETETEDMFQCLGCEDWLHSGCLEPHPDPDSWDDLVCAHCVATNPVLRAVLVKHAGGERTGMMVCEPSPNGPILHGQRSPCDNPNGQAAPSPLDDQPKNESLGDDTVAPPPESDTPGSVSSSRASSSKRPCPGPSSLAAGTEPDPKRRRPDGQTSTDLLGACQAPYPGGAGSPLAQLDPKFANVYLARGWRERWCRCQDCLSNLSRIDWLISEEEEPWEPEPDNDSMKSLLELGLDAFKHLPHQQMIEGLHAYNQLRDDFLQFLKPLANQGKLVTKDLVLEFFEGVRTKLLAKVSGGAVV